MSESDVRTPGEQIAMMMMLAFERLRRDLEAESQHDAAAAVRSTIDWLRDRVNEA